MRFPGSTEVVSALEKERAEPDSDDQSQKSQNGIPIAAGKTQCRTPGTTKKDKSPDHGKHTEDKSNDRCRAESGSEFTKEISRGKGTEYETDYLGAYILYHRRSMKSERSGNVPFEAGHANAHITRISPFLQKGGKYSYKNTDTDYAPPICKDIFHFSH
jgi:hypothetical protein